eukprot:590873-Lingulodinium_polyedra.AAC.1
MEAITGRFAELCSDHPERTRCYSACEVATHCQRALCAHLGPAAPEHVHTDITLRFNPAAVEAARCTQRVFASDVKGVIAVGWSRARVLQTVGTQMLGAIDSVLLRKPMLQDGWCAQCRN